MPRLTRRETLQLIAAATGVAAFADLASPRNAGAPLGDAAPLTDLGMELTAQQRSAGVEFVGHHVTVDNLGNMLRAQKQFDEAIAIYEGRRLEFQRRRDVFDENRFTRMMTDAARAAEKEHG